MNMLSAEEAARRGAVSRLTLDGLMAEVQVRIGDW